MALRGMHTWRWTLYLAWFRPPCGENASAGGPTWHSGTGAIAYAYGTSTLGACARVCSDLEILVVLVLELFLGYFFGAASLELTLSL